MYSRLFIMGSALMALAMTGCGSYTEIILNPEDRPISIVSEYTVSAAEMRHYARNAVHDAMANPRFKSFLLQYKRELNNVDAIPTLKLDRVVNHTNDSNLNVTEMTDILEEALFNANVVNVTRAEGAGLRPVISGSRDLDLDPNFDQSTVIKPGTLQAARIVLHSTVTSNHVSDGRRLQVERRFNMEISDLKTGFVIWKYSRPLGFIKKN